MRPYPILASLLILVGLAAPQAPEPLLLVACAPGYPGDTEQAQPTMDRFAQLVATAAGWDHDLLGGEYHRDEESGRERIAAGGDLVIVPLPFFLKHEHDLELRPIVQAVPISGEPAEVWSLVVALDRVEGPDDLDGWEVTGTASYAPAFVRGTLLGNWGPLPPTTRLTFTDRVLGALRRAAGGEDVAVLLDGDQSAALASLPFAQELEVIARSEPQIPALVASVGTRVDGDRIEGLREGLLEVHHDSSFAELFATLRLRRFAPIDHDALERARTGYRTAS